MALPQGLIFNIQRFSIQDGPGIRTTVFFKGCPFTCPWCSNPESMHSYPEIMVRDVRCICCGQCVAACPQGASTLVDGRRVIDFALCNNCMRCVSACTAHAIEAVGESKGVAEVMDVVLRDVGYYRSSGGGLTLSGGEPLAQWRFARELAKTARSKDVHVALDTTGYAAWETVYSVMEHIDLVLYDIKHMDAEAHRKYTGMPNQRILENLALILQETKAAVWVRIPVIPGFNQTGEAMAAIGAFLHELPRPVEKVSLLPFHKYAAGKYTAMGRPYPWSDKDPLFEADLAGFKQTLEAFHLEVDIGR